MALLGGVAAAQYVGPSTTPVYNNVATVLKTAVDDAEVSLQGVLLRKVGSDKYIFSDGTGEIRAEIDLKVFPATPISEKSKVRIRGKYEKDFLESPEIDVDFLEVLSP